jgi:hypothetical protein
MKHAALTALLALGATGPGWTATTAPASADPSGYEQVDRFNHFGRFDNWRAVDRDTLIVWTTPARAYLIELTRGSSDLRFAEAIGVTSTIGKTYAGLDSVLVRGSDYPIKAIYRLSRDQARSYGTEKTEETTATEDVGTI